MPGRLLGPMLALLCLGQLVVVQTQDLNDGLQLVDLHQDDDEHVHPPADDHIQGEGPMADDIGEEDGEEQGISVEEAIAQFDQHMVEHTQSFTNKWQTAFDKINAVITEKNPTTNEATLRLMEDVFVESIEAEAQVIAEEISQLKSMKSRAYSMGQDAIDKYESSMRTLEREDRQVEREKQKLQRWKAAGKIPDQEAWRNLVQSFIDERQSWVIQETSIQKKAANDVKKEQKHGENEQHTVRETNSRVGADQRGVKPGRAPPSHDRPGPGHNEEPSRESTRVSELEQMLKHSTHEASTTLSSSEESVSKVRKQVESFKEEIETMSTDMTNEMKQLKKDRVELDDLMTQSRKIEASLTKANSDRDSQHAKVARLRQYVVIELFCGAAFFCVAVLYIGFRVMQKQAHRPPNHSYSSGTQLVSPSRGGGHF